MIGGGMVPLRVCRVPVFPRDVARVAAAWESDRRSSYVYALSIMCVMNLMNKDSSHGHSHGVCIFVSTNLNGHTRQLKGCFTQNTGKKKKNTFILISEGPVDNCFGFTCPCLESSNANKHQRKTWNFVYCAHNIVNSAILLSLGIID